jgi:hypothetical protein
VISIASGGNVIKFVSSTGGAPTFSVVKTRIMNTTTNKQFVPYSFVLPCTIATDSSGTPSSVCTGNNGTENTGIAIIDAGANTWNANVLRLQIAQGLLFTNLTPDASGSVNTGYINVIDGLVNEANKYGMVATITLQEDTRRWKFRISNCSHFIKFLEIHGMSL